MPLLQSTNGPIYYQYSNKNGPPLTLIHGVGADHESWQWVIECLQQDYNILTLDLRGHGQSVKDGGPYSLDLFVADLVSLLDHLGIDQIHLAGFSLGGLIAQQFAISYPERLLSVAILSSIAGRSDSEIQAVQERVTLLEQQGAAAHLTNSVERWFSADFIKRHPERLEWRRRKSLQNDPASYLAAYRVLAESDLSKQLDQIIVPCLALTGELDTGSPPHMSQLIADRVLSGKVIILPRLKHSLLLEAPEKVATELELFISDAVKLNLNQIS